MGFGRFLASVAFACLANPAHAATFFEYVSQSGDSVGRGETGSVSPGNGTTFAASAAYGSSLSFPVGTNVSIQGGAPWELSFSSGPSTPLRPGTFTMTSTATSGAYMRVGRGVTGCFMTGQFTVYELESTLNGTVPRLAIDFVGHCQGADAAFYGGVRSQSPVPRSP